MTDRLSRQLDGPEVRVIGCLLEKEQATPEYYPLTLNALVAACNQRSNRDPVLKLSDRDVALALQRLVDDRMVTRDDTGRATRWSQKVDRLWGLNAASKAVLTVMLLRGPQTAGEVRARTVRLHEFSSAHAAEAALADLAAPPEPLVQLLERDPGQKEARWAHRVGVDDPAAPMPLATHTPRPAAHSEFDAELVMKRLALLEQQVQELQAALPQKKGIFDA
jgi:uncharacterized protein YceH (UPF0502 family)